MPPTMPPITITGTSKAGTAAGTARTAARSRNGTPAGRPALRLRTTTPSIRTTASTPVGTIPARKSAPTDNDVQERLLECGARMVEACVEASRPGRPARELVAVIQSVADEMGEGAFFIPYMAGHGMGCSQLEIPHIYPYSEDILAPNMWYAVECMVSDPARGTGQMEGIVLITPDGGSTCPKSRSDRGETYESGHAPRPLAATGSSPRTLSASSTRM